MKAIIVANWKMNPGTFAEAKKLFAAAKKAADVAKGVSVIVAPPSIYLHELRASYRGTRISFAGQNAHFEASGAHTGEISIPMLKDAKAQYLIVGHAERRAAGESNDDVRQKVAAAFAAKLIPILCVGENKRDQSGDHFDFVKEQLRTGLADATPAQLKTILIAYEPVWAIGADTAMSPRDMHEMAIFIRKSIVGYKGDAGMGAKILYGGAIDAGNALDMLVNGDVTGFMLGRASYDADKFKALMSMLGRAT